MVMLNEKCTSLSIRIPPATHNYGEDPFMRSTKSNRPVGLDLLLMLILVECILKG